MIFLYSLYGTKGNLRKMGIFAVISGFYLFSQVPSDPVSMKNLWGENFLFYIFECLEDRDEIIVRSDYVLFTCSVYVTFFIMFYEMFCQLYFLFANYLYLLLSLFGKISLYCTISAIFSVLQNNPRQFH